MIGTAKATVFPDPVFALPMQSLPGTSQRACIREGYVVLPARRGGMHEACTCVGLRMAIVARAETIWFETPRSVNDRILLLNGALSLFWGSGFPFDSPGVGAFAGGKSLVR
jgi:hypothetical protein